MHPFPRNLNPSLMRRVAIANFFNGLLNKRPTEFGPAAEFSSRAFSRGISIISSFA